MKPQKSDPPFGIAIAKTESNSFYLRDCQERILPVHRARDPAKLPEYFIRMVTDSGDVVVEPFAGSCVTGEVAERLDGKWVCVELLDEYLRGALGRVAGERDHVYVADNGTPLAVHEDGSYYRVPRLNPLWNGHHGPALPAHGGVRRAIASNAAAPTPDERSERSIRVDAAARRSG